MSVHFRTTWKAGALVAGAAVVALAAVAYSVTGTGGVTGLRKTAAHVTPTTTTTYSAPTTTTESASQKAAVARQQQLAQFYAAVAKSRAVTKTNQAPAPAAHPWQPPASDPSPTTTVPQRTPAPQPSSPPPTFAPTTTTTAPQTWQSINFTVSCTGESSSWAYQLIWRGPAFNEQLRLTWNGATASGENWMTGDESGSTYGINEAPPPEAIPPNSGVISYLGPAPNGSVRISPGSNGNISCSVSPSS